VGLAFFAVLALAFVLAFPEWSKKGFLFFRIVRVIGMAMGVGGHEERKCDFYRLLSVEPFK
jgi:hypothetical protein